MSQQGHHARGCCARIRVLLRALRQPTTSYEHVHVLEARCGAFQAVRRAHTRVLPSRKTRVLAPLFFARPLSACARSFASHLLLGFLLDELCHLRDLARHLRGVHGASRGKAQKRGLCLDLSRLTGARAARSLACGMRRCARACDLGGDARSPQPRAERRMYDAARWTIEVMMQLQPRTVRWSQGHRG